MAKHFLYLTNEKITCLVWHGNAFTAREAFDANSPHSQEFERYIIRHRNEPVFIVVDLTEEDFRLDKIPHLRGSDQDAVVARRLAQVYRNTTFRHAVIQDREPDGRRDDRVIYHAITNPELIKPWLTVLEKHGVPLEGIYSAPVLSGILLKTLDVFFPHTLLVSLVAGNGLRQTYFHNKQIKFSRLTPVEDESELSFGQRIADESSRTWQYLDSLRYFTTNDMLEVCILIHPSDRKEVTDAIQSYPLLQYRILDTDEVAAKIKLNPGPQTSHSEEIFVHLFAGEPIANQYALPEQTRNARMRKAGFVLYALAACFLAVGVAWTGYTLFQASAIDNEIDKRYKQAQELNSRYRAITGQAQSTQVSSDTSRDAALFYKDFMQPLPAPGNFLREISQLLAEFPDVKVAQIFWQASDDPKSNPPFTLTAPTGSPSVKSEYTGQDKPQNTAVVSRSPKDLSLSGNQYEVLVIDASISSFSDDYRKVLADIERFVTAVKKNPGLQASILASPLDIGPAATIRANLSERTSEPVEVRFAVRIVHNNESSTISQ